MYDFRSTDDLKNILSMESLIFQFEVLTSNLVHLVFFTYCIEVMFVRYKKSFCQISHIEPSYHIPKVSLQKNVAKCFFALLSPPENALICY